MSEERRVGVDASDIGAANRGANDVNLGSQLTVDWQVDPPSGVRYVKADLDGDGIEDHVYLRTWSVTSESYDVIYFSNQPQANPSSISESVAAVQRMSSSDEQGNLRSSSQIELSPKSIDFGDAHPMTDMSDWGLGQFKNVVRIQGKHFVVTGGNWIRPLVGRDWFPVRLFRVESPTRQILICELLPKYGQK